MDPKEFKQFADLVNKYEKNHDGADLVVGKDGRIILTFAPLGELSRGRTLVPNSREDLNVGEEARRTGKYAGEVNFDSSITRPERSK